MPGAPGAAATANERKRLVAKCPLRNEPWPEPCAECPIPGRSGGITRSGGNPSPAGRGLSNVCPIRPPRRGRPTRTAWRTQARAGEDAAEGLLRARHPELASDALSMAAAVGASAMDLVCGLRASGVALGRTTPATCYRADQARDPEVAWEQRRRSAVCRSRRWALQSCSRCSALAARYISAAGGRRGVSPAPVGMTPSPGFAEWRGAVANRFGDASVGTALRDAEVRHVFADMKTWKGLRNCRL